MIEVSLCVDDICHNCPKFEPDYQHIQIKNGSGEIEFNPYPIVNRNISCYGCETSIDLGFGSLDYSEITSEETRRIHTVTKEMTIEEIEEKLGYKIKIVSNNKEG